MRAYKLFKVSKNYPGCLFPLYVLSQKPTPIGVWLKAEEGERTVNGKVKSKLGGLCFRPGWHCSDIPLATHIGVKGASGQIEAMNKFHVWCEVEYEDTIDYTKEAIANGTNRAGEFIHTQAYLQHIPVHGFYRFKTNPHMLGEWIIAGNIRVNKVMSDREVAKRLESTPYSPMPRDGGEIDLRAYGF